METNSNEYFEEEVLRFRELMGKKSFWDNPELSSNAVYGLLYVYIHLKEPSEKEQIMMRSCLTEFDRRLIYVLMKGIEI